MVSCVALGRAVRPKLKLHEAKACGVLCGLGDVSFRPHSMCLGGSCLGHQSRAIEIKRATNTKSKEAEPNSLLSFVFTHCSRWHERMLSRLVWPKRSGRTTNSFLPTSCNGESTVKQHTQSGQDPESERVGHPSSLRFGPKRSYKANSDVKGNGRQRSAQIFKESPSRPRRRMPLARCFMARKELLLLKVSFN